MAQKIVSKNKKAFHDYHIEQTFEAGIVLTGPEVKSLRAGKVNLRDGYAQLKDAEVFLYNVHISPYTYATHIQQDPLRVRKLLLHRREILRLYAKANEQGHTLVPLKLYFKAGKAKITLALAKGKREFDKRETLRDRDRKRELDRARRQR